MQMRTKITNGLVSALALIAAGLPEKQFGQINAEMGVQIGRHIAAMSRVDNFEAHEQALAALPSSVQQKLSGFAADLEARKNADGAGDHLEYYPGSVINMVDLVRITARWRDRCNTAAKVFAAVINETDVEEAALAADMLRGMDKLAAVRGCDGHPWYQEWRQGFLVKLGVLFGSYGITTGNWLGDALAALVADPDDGRQPELALGDAEAMFAAGRKFVRDEAHKMPSSSELMGLPPGEIQKRYPGWKPPGKDDKRFDVV